jgi:hypothetical protein
MNKTYTSMNHFFSGTENGKIQCPVCGEMFKPAAEHIYHIGSNKRDLCCSWSCMRNWEKHKKVIPVKKKKHKTAIRIVETGETFKSVKACAEHFEVCYSVVYRALIHGFRCKGYHLEEVKEGEDE